MIVSNVLKLKQDELKRREWAALFKKMTYQDARQNIYQPWRVSTSGLVTLPRGAWSLLPDHVQYEDRRVCPEAGKHEFKLKLDAVTDDGRTFARQIEAVNSMFTNEQGLILRPPGTGKTQIALNFIANAGTTTLVLVNTKDILDQWVEYAERAIPTIEIGVIGDAKQEVGQLTIATVQSFQRLILDDRKKWTELFGCVVQDEAHHSPASTFELILNAMPAKYRFGFTASATRADGRHPYMKLVIGPVIHNVPFKSPVPVKVVPVKTDFYYPYRGRWEWSKMVDALTWDEDRNKQIAAICDREISEGNSILVLSRRVEHLYEIMGWMTHISDAEVLTGERKRSERPEVIEALRDGSLKCLLATQLADEALDIPRLSRVVLTHPGRAAGRIVQQVGRAIRESPGKTNAIVYDVYDPRIKVLNRQWQQRKKAYSAMSIKVEKRGWWGQ